jgi:hypothetical protein
MWLELPVIVADTSQALRLSTASGNGQGWRKGGDYVTSHVRNARPMTELVLSPCFRSSFVACTYSALLSHPSHIEAASYSDQAATSYSIISHR